MKNKLRTTLLLSGLVALFTFSSCESEKDYSPVDDLFRPRLLTANDYPLVVENTIVFVWFKINDAVSYTIEMSESQNFDTILQSHDTEETSIKIVDLPYNTKVFARIRANAADPANSSGWVIVEKTTDTRSTAIILREISKQSLTETSAVIEWKNDPENPIDSISLDPVDIRAELPSIGVKLTPGMVSAGKYTVEGLVKYTEYRVNVYDNTKEGVFDRPYNERTFRTAGAPPGATVVNIGEDFASVMSTYQSGTAKNGVFYLVPGYEGTIGSLNVTKGFKIVGAPGVRPKITMTGNLQFFGDVGDVSYEGVDLIASGASYIVNNGSSGVDYNLSLFSFEDVNFKGFGNCLIRTQGVGTKTYGTIKFNNCFLTNIGGTYSLFDFGMTGPESVDEFIFTNSTIANSEGLNGLFRARAGSMDYIRMTITNCTFFNIMTGRVFIQGAPFMSGSVVMNRILFARVDDVRNNALGSANGTYQNIYALSDVMALGSDYKAVTLSQSSESLFANPDTTGDFNTADFTIIDENSEVYTAKIGDPRWIK